MNHIRYAEVDTQTKTLTELVSISQVFIHVLHWRQKQSWELHNLVFSSRNFSPNLMQLDFEMGLQINIKNWFVVMEKVTILRVLTDMNKIKTAVLVQPNPKACWMKSLPTWMVCPLLIILEIQGVWISFEFYDHIFFKIIVCIDGLYAWFLWARDCAVELCPVLYSQCVWKVI